MNNDITNTSSGDSKDFYSLEITETLNDPVNHPGFSMNIPSDFILFLDPQVEKVNSATLSVEIDKEGTTAGSSSSNNAGDSTSSYAVASSGITYSDMSIEENGCVTLIVGDLTPEIRKAIEDRAERSAKGREDIDKGMDLE